MEAPWVQQFRNIFRRQQMAFVDGKITDDHHLSLKRSDGSEVDAGEIKVKPPGSVVVLSIYPYETEPDIYVTKDGITWHPGASEGKFQGGTDYSPDSGCWTGDRFIVPIYVYDEFSPLLQSKDGGTWSLHPDTITFSDAIGYIYGMDATGTGLVVAAGAYFGEDGDSPIAVSHDFGNTWTVLPVDVSFDTTDPFLEWVTVKNDFEWVISDGDFIWYTVDGGTHWTHVTWPSEFNTWHGIRWFNGYWWLYGRGSGDAEWDTVLIKSKDLLNWISVPTPWSGASPYWESWIGGPDHEDESGEIFNMEYNEITNTVIAVGRSMANDSVVLMSDDGGTHWFEVGYATDIHFNTDFGWDGVYKWPPFFFDGDGGGLAYGYGWWFAVSISETPGPGDPPIIRISISGETTELVYPAAMQSTAFSIILSGGDVTF